MRLDSVYLSDRCERTYYVGISRFQWLQGTLALAGFIYALGLVKTISISMNSALVPYLIFYGMLSLLALVIVFRFPDQKRKNSETIHENVLGNAWLMGLLAILSALIFQSLWQKNSFPISSPFAFRESERLQVLLQWGILSILLAPCAEEFVFRRLFYSGLRSRFNLPVAIAVSAGVFALLHPSGSWMPVFMVGILTALAWENTRKLLVPVLIHVIYNAFFFTFESGLASNLLNFF